MSPKTTPSAPSVSAAAPALMRPDPRGPRRSPRGAASRAAYRSRLLPSDPKRCARRRSARRRPAARAPAAAAAARPAGRGRAARVGAPTGCTSSRARGRRAATASRRRRPPRRSGARRAPRRAGAAPRAARAPSAVGSRAGVAHDEDVELGAQPLRRAPRAAHDALGARRRAWRARAAARRSAWPARLPNSRSSRTSSVSRTRRLASTSSATWRSATSRSACEVLDLEEAVQRGGDARSADRPCPRAGAAISASGVRSIEHDLVGLGQHAVGHRLAHAHAGELGDVVVERLEVLDVDRGEDVDAGVEHVGDVLVALARARAPARWCARARRSGTSSGARARTAGRSISSSVVPR